MKKNQFFVNYLTLTLCFVIFYGLAQAQPGCSQWDWCRHKVEIKNNSCCEVEMNFLHEFPQLDIDGYCNAYNFEYRGSGSCSKPNLNTSNDQHICAGQSVEICADGANSYWWSNGKDKRCITVSPSHTKTFTVTGKKNGCEARGEVTVNVNDKFRMPSSDDQHICAGQSVKICAEGADSYHWGNGKQSACITVSPDHTKTYTVTGAKNGCKDTDHITVNVNGSFNLQTSNDKTICSGQSVEICADGADNYWWSNGKESKCITVSPNHTKTFSVTGVKNGCEADAHIKVNVNDKFSMPSSDDQTICAGQSVEICASEAEGYLWSNGKESACITVSPHQTETYTVVGGKNGCKDTDYIKVNVNDSFNLQTDNDKNICSGQSVKICADGAHNYWWSNGKEGACITVSPDHTKTYSVVGVKITTGGVMAKKVLASQ